MKLLPQWKKYRKGMDPNHFRVAIYGSARIKRNDPRYKRVMHLAQMIGDHDMDIVTGGGPGVMDAASRGHAKGKKGKSKSYGLLIHLPMEQKTSKHLDIKKEFHIFSNRLDNFMALSNVCVVSQGGIGTLLELFYSWQLIQVGQVCQIPIILMGNHWKGLIDWIKQHLLKEGMIAKGDLDFIYIVKNEREAMEIIEATYDEYQKGTAPTHVCKEIQKKGVFKKYSVT